MRDALAVVELIELGFRPELGPAGLKMLKRMRQRARRDMWLPPLYEPDPPPGWVWCEAGQVVANLSFRRAAPHRSRGWLIGNVVVHPDYRGQGIGRQLMEQALAAAQEHRAHWVGLEVRADNEVARRLYESLGFRKVGQLFHLIRPADEALGARHARRKLSGRKGHPQDREHWHRLAQELYPRRQREVLEIRPLRYNFGGWERSLYLWLDGERERTWLERAAIPRWAVRVHTDRRDRFYEWEIVVHPRSRDSLLEEALAQAIYGLRRYAAWPIVTQIADWPPLLRALQARGFKLHRTLWQMRREFSRE